jgi:hypothetical protein
MEPSRMFLDVGLYRNEVLVNECGGLLVFVRLGIQPSASASSWRRAEVQQDRPALFLCGRQRLIDVSTPLHRHGNLHYC